MEPNKILEGKDLLVKFLKSKDFKEEKDYYDPEYDKASYFKIGRRRLLAVYEVLDIETIKEVRNHFLLEKGLSYCAILHDGKVLFFRNFGEGRYFLYSERTKYNRAKIDKLRRIDENFDILFQRKDISGLFYEKFNLKRDFLVRHIKNDIKPVEKYLLAQKIFDRIFFIYFLCHKGIIKFKDGGAISGENLFKIMIDDGNFIKNLKNLFYRFNSIKENNFLDVGDYKIKIPYLNGGLFRPDPLEPDLKFDLKERNWKIIFDFLNQYHWIIEEHVEFAIEDEEKVLTPEILGHVYERSVVEWEQVGFKEEAESAVKQTTERKKKGVFYTPEDVTSYVAQNSIYSLILAQFGGKYEDIDDLLEEGSEKELMEALNHLSKVKVLDPACGSGAFLIKASEILFHLKVRILNKFGKKTKYYDVKLDTITENIYGVDILEGAIEIAKLRLWLWLVSDYVEGVEIQSLPNIEYNLKVGNSLIGWVDEKLKQIPLIRPLTDEVQGIFLGLIAYSNNTERRIFERARELLTTHKLEDYIEAYALLYQVYRKTHGLKAENLKGILRKVRNAVYGSVNPPFLDFLNEKIDPKYRKKKPLKLPISQAIYKSLIPFHWRIDFGHIIQNGGFDIVIGNPPWGIGVLSKKEKEALEHYYKTSGSREVSAYFLERELNLLKEKGTFGNIIAESIAVNKGTTPGRDILREKLEKPKVAFIGTRPAKIFRDVEKRVCLITGTKDTSVVSPIYSSRNVRFTRKERPLVLSNLTFENTKGLILGSRMGVRENNENTRMPKIGILEIRRILKKLRRISDKERIIEEIIAPSGYPLDYKASGGYWLHALKKFPYNSTMVKQLFFKKKLERDFILLVIDSSLFYLFWAVYGNNRHLQKEMLDKFPVPSKEKLIMKKNEIGELSYRLNAALLNCFDENTGRVGEFDTAACKDIIDEIDDLLGKLYGLTNEEVEFIKNYDKHIRPNRSRTLK